MIRDDVETIPTKLTYFAPGSWKGSTSEKGAQWAPGTNKKLSQRRGDAAGNLNNDAASLRRRERNWPRSWKGRIGGVAVDGSVYRGVHLPKPPMGLSQYTAAFAGKPGIRGLVEAKFELG